MEYKRLTDRDITKVCFDTWELCGLDDVCKRDCRKPEPCKIPQIILRLAKLEDEIEAGMLVELPCKVGDVMYEVIEGMPIQEWKIESICFNRAYPKGVIWAERTRDFAHWKFWIEDCGTKWLSTKAEAEKRLKEIRNETKSIDNSEK